MTSFLDAPQPAYGGNAVRIRAYWSKQILSNMMQYLHTFNEINLAIQVLRKYTLDLDWGTNIYGLDFYDSIFVNSSGYLNQLEQIRDLIRTGYHGPPPENRLIVVFTPLRSTEIGHTIYTYPRWLPWILIDPRQPAFTGVLLHEIGHACRLGHYADTLMQIGVGGPPDILENFQVHEIYRSYWCTGPRPVDWWHGLARTDSDYQPFLWPPKDQLTP